MNASGKLPATAHGLAPDAESLIRFMRSTFPQSHRCKEIADKTHIESGTIHEILIDTLQPRGLVKIWTKSSLSSPATTPSKSLLSSSSSSISTPDSIIPIPIVEDQWVYVIQKEDIAASDPAALKFAASPAKPPPPNQESSAIAIDFGKARSQEAKQVSVDVDFRQLANSQKLRIFLCLSKEDPNPKFCYNVLERLKQIRANCAKENRPFKYDTILFHSPERQPPSDLLSGSVRVTVSHASPLLVTVTKMMGEVIQHQAAAAAQKEKEKLYLLAAASNQHLDIIAGELHHFGHVALTFHDDKEMMELLDALDSYQSRKHAQ